MESNHEQPEYTRRKFTLPPSTDTILTSLAERHYQGNVSLFLRAAIEDHRDTLEGTGSGERTLHELGRGLQELSSTQGQLDEKLTAIIEKFDNTQSPQRIVQNPITRTIPEPANQIYHQILEGEHPRFEDINETTSLPQASIHEAIHFLLDHGFIAQTHDGRFQPTGYDTETRSD